MIPDDVKALALPVLRHRLTHVAERGDRGADHRPDPARDPRPDAGAAMTRPTGRAVVLFACGHPAGAVRGRSTSRAVGAVVQLRRAGAARRRHRRAAGLPAAPARREDRGAGQAPYRRAAAPHGHVAAAPWPRATRFEAIADQRGEVEPAELVAGELRPGARPRIALPVVPRRRGQVKIDRVWLRWRGPLGLVELTRGASTLERTRRRAAQRARRPQRGAAVLRAGGDLRHQGAAAEGGGHRVRGAARIRARPRQPLHRLEAFGAPPQARCARNSAPSATTTSSWPSIPAI